MTANSGRSESRFASTVLAVRPCSLAPTSSDKTRTGRLTCNFSVELRRFEPLTPLDANEIRGVARHGWLWLHES